MKTDVVQKLEKILEDDLNNLEKLSLDDPVKPKAIQSIKSEAAIILGVDKERSELVVKERQSMLDKAKFDFEKKKVEDDKEIKEKQLELDKEKFKFDSDKFQHEIENDRIQNQTAITKMENDARAAKIQIIISAVGVISTFLLGLIGKLMYNKLASNAQFHEYKDYQMEPPSSKENRMNLLK